MVYIVYKKQSMRIVMDSWSLIRRILDQFSFRESLQCEVHVKADLRGLLRRQKIHRKKNLVVRIS